MAHRLAVGDVVGLAQGEACLRGCKVVGIWRAEDLGEETAAPTIRNMARNLMAAAQGSAALLAVTPGMTPVMLVRLEDGWRDVGGMSVSIRVERAAA